MWQGIQTVTDIKPPSTGAPTSSATLPDQLNYFYARFDLGNGEVILKADLPPDEQPLTLSTSDVCSTLGRILRACAEQLDGVFKDIFNLSPAQAVVPPTLRLPLLCQCRSTLQLQP